MDILDHLAYDDYLSNAVLRSDMQPYDRRSYQLQLTTVNTIGGYPLGMPIV